MPNVAFSRASGFGTLFQLVESEAGEAGLMALRHRLPLPLPLPLAHFGRMQPVPFHLMNGAFNAASTVMDDRLLGARVGLMFALNEFAPFAEFALAGSTLRDVIDRACAAQPMHSSAETLDLRLDDDRAAWRLRYTVGNKVNLTQIAHRTLMPMLGAVLRYGRGDLAQVQLNLTGADRACAVALERLLALRVKASQLNYEIEFPAAWLGNPTPLPGLPPDIAAKELATYLDQPLPPSMVAAVIAALDLTDEMASAGIDSTARVFGMHRHALQRALCAEHVSYRDLLRHVRIDRAAHLLSHTKQSLAEIALRTGYSDQANFHRAFVAIMGLTPARFRTLRSTT